MSKDVGETMPRDPKFYLFFMVAGPPTRAGRCGASIGSPARRVPNCELGQGRRRQSAACFQRWKLRRGAYDPPAEVTELAESAQSENAAARKSVSSRRSPLPGTLLRGRAAARRSALPDRRGSVAAASELRPAARVPVQLPPSQRQAQRRTTRRRERAPYAKPARTGGAPHARWQARNGPRAGTESRRPLRRHVLRLRRQEADLTPSAGAARYGSAYAISSAPALAPDWLTATTMYCLPLCR